MPFPNCFLPPPSCPGFLRTFRHLVTFALATLFPCDLLRSLLFALSVLQLPSCIGIFKEDVSDPREDKISKAPKLTDNDDTRVSQ